MNRRLVPERVLYSGSPSVCRSSAGVVETTISSEGFTSLAAAATDLLAASCSFFCFCISWFSWAILPGSWVVYFQPLMMDLEVYQKLLTSK